MTAASQIQMGDTCPNLWSPQVSPLLSLLGPVCSSLTMKFGWGGALLQGGDIGVSVGAGSTTKFLALPHSHALRPVPP